MLFRRPPVSSQTPTTKQNRVRGLLHTPYPNNETAFSDGLCR
ncbi:hypothetical protein HMPREF9123_1602 [Neisseria bacilliformis ATCC BAA-1200]|uniref:Uncharacterized protein n=1 Tax=Neisseria bacilliformis ATCC BAA-1200 TaxID=888742 RepID=F2BCX2_9NEIS|nr:hypothetical protein HMPREF9123_1602 [Neisseria bacilliformis ATCC BAA-1200]